MCTTSMGVTAAAMFVNVTMSENRIVTSSNFSETYVTENIPISGMACCQKWRQGGGGGVKPAMDFEKEMHEIGKV